MVFVPKLAIWRFFLFFFTAHKCSDLCIPGRLSSSVQL